MFVLIQENIMHLYLTLIKCIENGEKHICSKVTHTHTQKTTTHKCIELTEL